MSLTYNEKRRELIRVVRSWEGTPFVHGQRSPPFGIDCGGPIVCGGNAVGLRTHDVATYPYQPWPNRLVAELEKGYKRIEQTELAVGSIIVFWIVRKKIPQHLGLWTGENTILHAWTDAGKLVESSFDLYWQERVYACFDYHNDDDHP